MNRLSQYLPDQHDGMPIGLGFEAIDTQFNGIFRDALVARIQTLMDNAPVTANKVKAANLSDLIETHTGIKTKIEFKARMFNAYVFLPQLSKSNPIVNSMRQNKWMEKDAKRLLRNKTDVIEGSVNLRTGRVDGVFSEIVSTMGIGEYVINGKYLTAKEAAAIVMHEIGHVFTYYEMLTRTANTNYIIRATVENVLSESEHKKRVQILKDVEKMANFEFDDKDSLAESDNAETYAAIIIKQAEYATRSELGVNLYDQRGAESLADQFAARQGLAVELATALDKLYRKYGDSAYYTPTVHYIVEVAQLTAIMLSIVVGASTGGVVGRVLSSIASNILLMMTVTAVTGLALSGDYDNLYHRQRRVRAQLVESLKNKHFPEAMREQTNNDIKRLDDIMEKLEDNVPLAELFARHLSPWGRKHAKSMVFQQQLEDLLTNDLFVKASELKVVSV